MRSLLVVLGVGRAKMKNKLLNITTGPSSSRLEVGKKRRYEKEETLGFIVSYWGCRKGATVGAGYVCVLTHSRALRHPGPC